MNGWLSIIKKVKYIVNNLTTLKITFRSVFTPDATIIDNVSISEVPNPIRKRKLYTRVNFLRCKQIAHANAKHTSFLQACT